jgi:hypothetical protein
MVFNEPPVKVGSIENKTVASLSRTFHSSDPIHDHKECDHRAKTQGYNNWHDLTSDLVWLLKRYGWVSNEGKVTKAMTDAIERANRTERI